ncbi:hypothetical protein [Natronorubrum sp. FCH18a]|uniref:hypothetical protein n=1 Tax=Natronorubrum sp. FCH18a TaxID=3447018 RepID=UPI003F5175AD
MDQEVEVALIVLQVVVIVLPLWLGGVRYYISNVSDEADHSIPLSTHYFIFLTYISLFAVLFVAVNIISSGINSDLSAGIWGIMMFVSGMGIPIFELLREGADSDYVSTGYKILSSALFCLTIFFSMVMTFIYLFL